MKVTWRQLPTVLFEDEVLDKAFSRARKAADEWKTQTVFFELENK